MIGKIEELLRRVEEFRPKTAAEVEEFRIKVLGKKGELNALMEEFKRVAPELKREVGQRLNALKQAATERVAALRAELQESRADDAEAILGTFCTTDAHNDRVNYFLNEFFGTFMLVLGALCCLSLPWGKANPAAASIVVGFIVWGLVTSMGGPTGPGLNPARDLMPRLLHAILPIPNKGDSRWGEAWIPVVAPIAGAIVGAFLFKVLFA